jgi:hypothetical protein
MLSSSMAGDDRHELEPEPLDAQEFRALATGS